MKEIKVNATKEQIERFKESILWQDIVNELSAWKKGFEIELKSIVDDAAANNPSTASVLLHMGDLNGRLKAVEYMIGILDLFMIIIDEQNKEKEDKSLDNESSFNG